MSRQSIARTAWYDTQGGLAVYDTSCHLVHRSVAPNSHNDVFSFVFALGGYLLGMTCIFGKTQLHIVDVSVYMTLNKRGDNIFASRA
jgi:hypothetical protein